MKVFVSIASLLVFSSVLVAAGPTRFALPDYQQLHTPGPYRTGLSSNRAVYQLKADLRRLENQRSYYRPDANVALTNQQLRLLRDNVVTAGVIDEPISIRYHGAGSNAALLAYDEALTSLRASEGSEIPQRFELDCRSLPARSVLRQLKNVDTLILAFLDQKLTSLEGVLIPEGTREVNLAFNQMGQDALSSETLQNIGFSWPVSVEVLNLSYNEITRPDKLLYPAMLRELSLEQNFIRELYAPVGAWHHLEKLNVKSQFTHVERVNLPLPATLTSFDASNNGLDNYKISGITFNEDIADINLMYNAITHVTPSTFGRLPRLRTLNLYANELKSIDPKALSRSVTRLDIGSNSDFTAAAAETLVLELPDFLDFIYPPKQVAGAFLHLKREGIEVYQPWSARRNPQ